ncbi:SapC family protein [Polymorphobacter megasporae]|uniref:SapC family protein n=1 Tax=Glacieibacterium megasporae TaxID=2835787 RepID=UPI0021045DA5|nr:SapC family protein [Polymorphobacter megasporae]
MTTTTSPTNAPGPMTNIVRLNNIDHAGLRVITARGAERGDAVNQIPVFPTEFEAVQRDFPIVLHRTPDGAWEALALLGLDRDENLFLDGDRWIARYIPALLDRGPFSIGVHTGPDGQREPMVHIDLAHQRIVRDGSVTPAGEPLFLPHGGNAPYLERMQDILQVIHTGYLAQSAMFGALADAGLIEPVRIEIQLDETLRYDLVDFHTIGIEALARLSGAALESLHRQGLLAAAVHIASSLGNVSRLIALKNAKRAG